MRHALIGFGTAVTIAVAVAAGSAQQRTPRTVAYEGARLIIGDATPPIASGTFVVTDGRITAVGAKGAVAIPAGAAHVDLTGRTVMPALVNVRQIT